MRIKDPKRRLETERKRDSCKYYAPHSGSCLAKKILSCYTCVKYRNKLENKEDT